MKDPESPDPSDVFVSRRNVILEFFFFFFVCICLMVVVRWWEVGITVF